MQISKSQEGYQVEVGGNVQNISFKQYMELNSFIDREMEYFKGRQYTKCPLCDDKIEHRFTDLASGLLEILHDDIKHIEG